MKKKARLFDIRRLPQDIGRLVCLPLLPWYRMQRLTPEGSKYSGKLRGGAIIAANHTSFTDPFSAGVAFWYRRMFFLVAEVVMQGKLRRALLRGVGAVEIDRKSADIEAIKRSVAILKSGRVLTVFPQGGIARGDSIGALKSGAVLMALQADVPIVPMHIIPKKKWYHRRRVVIGTTLYPKAMVTKKIPSTADIQRITHALMEEMNRCRTCSAVPEEAK